MDEPLFEHDDGAGRLLSVYGRDDGIAALQFRVAADPVPRGYCTIGPGDSLELMIAVHRACGVPVPVVLGRPEVDPHRAYRFSGISFRVAGPGSVEVEAGAVCEQWPPSEVRRMCATGVAVADEAGEAPEPGSADDLADRLAALRSMGLSEESTAKALLRDGWRKEVPGNDR